MSQSGSRLISGLLMFATLVFAGSVVRDAHGAAVVMTPSPAPSAALVVAATRDILPSPSSPNVVISEKTVAQTRRVATPLRKARRPVAVATPTVVPSQVITITPTTVPTVPFVTPTSVVTPVPTATPRPVGVTYAISGGGANLQGEIDSNGESVGALTKRVAAERGVSFVYEVSDMGWFVTEIAGVKQNPRLGYYWLFYINGQLSNRGADAATVQAGDVLSWKYEHI